MNPDASTLITLERVLRWLEIALYVGGGIFLFFLIVGLALALWLNSRRKLFKARNPYVTLAIEIPPLEIKSPKAVENVIAQLYGIKSVFRFHEKWWRGEYALQASLDIIGQDGYVQFVAHIPKKYEILFERSLYAQYPDINITSISDYTEEVAVADLVTENRKEGRYDLWGTEFILDREGFFPLRTYPLFYDASGKEFSDPLIAVIEMLSHLKRGERFWYQITVGPSRVGWQAKGVNAIKQMVEGTFGKTKEVFFFAPVFGLLAEALRLFIEVIGSSAGKIEELKSKKRVASQDSEKTMTLVPPEYDLIVKAIREKISRLGFVGYVRALYIAEKQVFDSRQVVGDFQGIMRQFANPQMNALTSNRLIEVSYPQIWFPRLRAKWRKRRLLRRAKLRYCGLAIDDPNRINPFAADLVSARNILSVEELATLWHFPVQEAADKGGTVKRVLSKKVHPKQVLPQGAFEDEGETIELAGGEAGGAGDKKKIHLDPDITFFAQTNFRRLNQRFGIKQEDRRRHMYIIGKTGMGKTTCLENMIYQDILRGSGVAVIDPHGDLVEHVLDMVPSSRVNDTIYFNPADGDYPVAFNILAEEDVHHRYLIASSLVGIFKKIWADSWGPRLEYLLRNSLLSLLETKGNTILGVNRLFVDKPFRDKIVKQIADPVVKHFWLNEYAKYNQNFQVEAVSPIQNKLGQFISIPLIRNMIGQVNSKLNFREIIDTKKIFLVNLAKGLIGEDVSALLGATIISKLQIAAMMRADIKEEERPDFYLYIDEFQNFSTESFATILSEARKYRLNLIMAHQYLEQLDELVAAAIFGNVGTMICFGIGAEDGEVFEQQFAPEFLAQDLVNLGKYEVVLRLMINGTMSRSFSAETVAPPPPPPVSSREKIMKVSRERYAIQREVIEEKLLRWLK